MHFQIYPDKSNEYRWRLVAVNKKIVADSAEGYSTKSNCRKAVNRLIHQFKNKEIKVYDTANPVL